MTISSINQVGNSPASRPGLSASALPALGKTADEEPGSTQSLSSAWICASVTRLPAAKVFNSRRTRYSFQLLDLTVLLVQSGPLGIQETPSKTFRA